MADFVVVPRADHPSDFMVMGDEPGAARPRASLRRVGHCLQIDVALPGGAIGTVTLDVRAAWKAFLRGFPR